ncbi:MAG: xylulokinase [Cognaticolwellia sp.]
MIGGGSKSPLWRNILASVLSKPLTYKEGGEVGPAFGAAKLARIGLEKLSASRVCNSGKVKWIIDPDKVMQKYYRVQHKKHQDIYQSIKEYF